MAFEQTWRWFGPNDPVSLKEIKQTGATGVVTALHYIPVGEVWTVDEIQKRKEFIEAEGLTWSVAESLPVHENIKKRKNDFKQLIENYKTSIRNLGTCGIDTICYNFMPVLDWSRTDLNAPFPDGSTTSKFESKAFAAFDLFVLKRSNAENDYTKEQFENIQKYFESLNDRQKDKLMHVILLGLPGSDETFTIEQLHSALSDYQEIGDKELRQNLHTFQKEVVPTAEESNVLLAIHPDDPPRPLLGLPRIVSNKNDLEQIVATIDSNSNGITFCTGSLGAGMSNDCSVIARRLAHRINFVHLRNVAKNSEGDFIEEYHLDGDVDMYAVMKTLVIEQQRRKNDGRKDVRMPFRPDHGHLILDDQHARTYYPGYSLYGRMRGLAELRGLEFGIRRELNL